MTARPTAAGRIAAARLDWIVPDWPAAAAVEAFVTTRNGRDDAGAPVPFDPGPQALPQDAGAAAAVRIDRERLARFLPADPCWLEQVHGTRVVVVDGAHRASDTPRADGAVTRTANVVLAIRAADCMPVLFCDRAGTAVGAAHAGWRGLAAGVLENTLAALDRDPGEVLAWLGPAIGRDAFEVGPEVRDAFTRRDAGAAAAFVPGRADRWHADLEALARMRLARAGVGSVYGSGLCTYSDATRFRSWRRDRSSGRMAALIWIAGSVHAAIRGAGVR